DRAAREFLAERNRGGESENKSNPRSHRPALDQSALPTRGSAIGATPALAWAGADRGARISLVTSMPPIRFLPTVEIVQIGPHGTPHQPSTSDSPHQPALLPAALSPARRK